MSKENFNGLVVRLISVLVMAALFLPLLYPQKSQAAFHNSISLSSQTTAPVFSPPESFQFSSSTSQSSSFNLSVSDLTSNISNLFSASRLSASFEMSKTSTLTGKISSFFAPLFFAPNSSTTAAALLLPSGTTSFDFDGDGRADVARWQSTTGEWKIKNSSNGNTSTYLLGSNGNTIAPADYDGDGKTDSAVFNASVGVWTIKKSSDSTTQTITNFGQSGDKAVSGDYDGDGFADAAVYRNGTWLVKQSSNGNIVSTSFGATSDIPVIGNYDGDLRMDYAVFRPSEGIWYISASSAGFSAFQWGLSSDIPVPADYDGDNKTDFAVYRSTSGTWYAYKSSTNDGSYIAQNWGNYGDQPVPADYDGDNKSDFAIWRPTTGVWFSIKSSDNSYDYKTLGIVGDTPVPSAYLKQTGAQVSAYDLAKARLSPKNATGGTDFYSRNFGWSTGLVGLSGRAGLDAGFGISYNSLVWTKQGNAIVFDADNSNVSPGFRIGFPTIEPVYYDSQTGKFAYLMVSPSGARTEFRQTGASSYYETADSSYAQLYGKGADSPNTPVEDLSLTLTSTDGTRMSYSWIAGAFRCSKIKDSNGNFITVNHDEYGLLRTLTDTLGRIVTVNYDSQFYPTTITQTWQNGTHTYATFSYTTITINTNFDSSLAVFGPANGTTLKVLDKITFADNGSTRFDYNSYGQVWRVNNHAADNHKLNHLAVNLDSVTQIQTDCPRFSETKNYVENFNGGNEVISPNSIQENQTYNVPDASGTGTLIQVNAPNGVVSKTYVGSSGWREGLAIVSEDWVNDGQGLQRKRWSWTNYTQDNPNLSYIDNPRVIETKVGDETNVKRTTIDYYAQSGNPSVALYGLTSEVKIYDANQTSILKRLVTEYNLDGAYLSRRIIGLPSKSELYDGQGALMSKTTYNYDEGDFSDASLEQNISPIQHDNTSYGASFITGRGNLTSTTRWDVSGQSLNVTSSVKYNTSGASVAQIDPLNRTVKISYADVFDDAPTNRNTFAYPTRLTDAAGNYSEVKYRFDIGANVWAKSPAPAGSQNGKTTERLFDSIGRISKETVLNTGAYTRYEYPASQNYSRVFKTITDTNNNGADAADEVLAETYTDGAGRTRMTRTEMPNSAGGWSGSLIEYDIMSRVKRQTVPTEINANWNPAGDDASRGWLWTQAEYDWKGRVTRKVNTDGTDTLTNYEGCGCAGGEIVTVNSEQLAEGRREQKSYSDILGRNYKTEAFDWQGNIYKTVVNSYNGRDQAVLTREYAGTETSNEFQETIYNYDGHGRLQVKHMPEQDANKFTTYTYFADDKPQTITDARGAAKQYQYNSLGLIQQISYQSPSQVPIVFTEPTLTQVSENVDGSIYKLAFKGLNFDSNAELSVDILINNGTTQQNLRYSNLERSTENGEQVLKFDIASDSYLYNYVNTNSYVMKFSIINPNTNKRTQYAYIDYLNGSGGRYVRVNFSPPERYYSIAETPTVSFSYDNLGNRISMNDGFGSVAYQYNELSQITAETRQFNETIPNAPLANNQFKIQYAYGLAGQLKSLTEPFGEIISYGHDKAGRLKSVSGNRVNEGVQLNYVTDAKYRAWGAVKRLDYGNNAYVGMNYNNRLQAEDYTLTNNGSSVIDYQSYQYYSDGRLRFSSPSPNSNFDRLYEYDFLGRLTTAKTGAESRGQTETNSSNRPYRMTLGYNQFGDIINQQKLHWGATFSSTFQFQNQRMTSETETRSIPGWVAQTTMTSRIHDADGRPLEDMKYDADGHISHITKEEREAVSGHDGEYYEWNGSSVKYDGDGNTIKMIKAGILTFGSGGAVERRIFRIRSSVVGDVITKLELDWTPSGGYNLGLNKKEHRYVYANGKEIAERRIYLRPLTPSSEDSTVLKTSDASGVDKSEMTLYGNGYSTLSLKLDPFGADVGTNAAYPPPSGNPDPQNNPDCEWHDPEDFDCEFPEGYDEAENEDQQAGSIPENTCYVDGVEADCNEVAENPELYESDDVALDDEDKAPSEEGPQSVWDDDDQSHQSSEGEEREFEVEYSGMNARIRSDIMVNVSMPMPRLSSWDLRRETSSSTVAMRSDASVLTFVSNQEAKIAEQLRNMASEACANAFKAAGLRTPTQVVDSGITIFPAYLLKSPTDMSKFGLNSNSTEDSAFRSEMKKAWDAAPFTNDVTTTGGYEYKGRLYMALPQRAFDETDGSFGVTFVHAMMHAAGAKGRNTHPETVIKSYRISITPEDITLTTAIEEVPNRAGQHDLTWMDKKLYDAIIENCAKK